MVRVRPLTSFPVVYMRKGPEMRDITRLSEAHRYLPRRWIGGFRGMHAPT